MELPLHWRNWGIDLELPDDVARADWVVAALRLRGQDRFVRVSSYVPDCYDAYARILHPSGGLDGNVRWADLAGPRGIEIGPETGFCAASGLTTRDVDAWHRAAPSHGSLPERQMAALGRTVAPFTSTPDDCVFCFWIGWGSWGGRGSHVVDPSLSHAENDSMNRRLLARAMRERARLWGLPELRLRWREYYLFTGPLARTGREFLLEQWHQSPSMWWPHDRAWFVATEIDGFSTYVGGTAACVDAILRCPDVEAIPVTAETLLDPWVYG